MTLEQAIKEAKKQGDKTGIQQLIYKSRADGGYWLAFGTLPSLGLSVCNYYPEGYTCSSGFYPREGY